MHTRLTLLVVAAPLLLAGCSFLEGLDLSELETTVDEAQEIESTVRDGVSDVQIGVAGLSPSNEYSQTGELDLGLVSQTSGTTVANAENVVVEVRNHDGSYSACEESGGEVHGAAATNVLTMMIDGSGSMERTYDPADCATCPHDPGRERVGAAHRFIDTLFDASRDSRLAIAEFGPEPNYTFLATRLHSDFNDDRRQLWTALDSIGGHEPLGTPLWDSVTEMLDDTAFEADETDRAIGSASGRYMVVLSDGRDNDSHNYGLWDAIAAANDAGIVIYAVGLGPASASPGYGDDQTNTVLDLQTLASETGGFYASVEDPERLHQLFDNIAYAMSGGYERRTYRCMPRATAETPDAEVQPPSSGTRVEGRMTQDGRVDEWAFIAP